MSAIQAVSISGYEQRSTPTPHIVYRIEVKASVRSWQMWRRYSEFTDLHTELVKSAGPPPAQLPSKHILSLTRTFNDKTIIAERRESLEIYLRAIVSSKEGKWRDTYAFKEFLGIPAAKQAGLEAACDPNFNISSWLDEQIDLQALVRDIRADLNKRDALADRGDATSSHSSSVQAKKKLASLIVRVGALTKGLESLGLGGMSPGEVQRRTDMVARLQDDCEKLSQMVIAAKHVTRASAPASDNDARRAALLRPAVGSANVASRPITRVFGASTVPQETDTTRPLDEHGLLQLQQLQIEQQDQQLTQLGTILQRQKQLGIAIGNEIAEQIELLDEFSNDVDNVSHKLGAAKKQMNKLG